MSTNEASTIENATTLIGQFATAFVSAVPTDPADDGFFGPTSVTWRVASDLTAVLSGLRALILQGLHPRAMAGVDQHSSLWQDPIRRLADTSGYTATITYSDKAAVLKAAARVRAIHEHVRGMDPVTGQPYAASEPALLLWVHATLVDSGMATANLFGTPLSPPDADRYVSEMKVAVSILGAPEETIPASVAELDDYLTRVRPELQCTPTVTKSLGHLFDVLGAEEEVADIWELMKDATIASLPQWAREMHGFPAPPPMTPERRTEIRQTLGLLDSVFIGEPGVLEARQRITLRTRAAR